ncbi:MAG: hypothetical protein OXU81_09755 [Gammaproteobacteria bacterium]|nr:hypothetical protein [Gammaproteobacteria bacterium]
MTRKIGVPLRLRLAAAVVVFLGSYLPLSLILLLQDFDYALFARSVCWPPSAKGTQCVIPLAHPAASLGFAAACGACFAATVLVLRLTKARAKVSIVIERAKYIPSELMGYALPYIVAFVNMDYEPKKLAGLAIFFVWLFWITYRSGQIVLNPFLVAFGWKLYELTYRFTDSETEHSGKALCDNVVAGGVRCRHTTIDDVIIIRTETQGDGNDHVG